MLFADIRYESSLTDSIPFSYLYFNGIDAYHNKHHSILKSLG